MGHTFFNDLANGEKEIKISYLIDTSATPKQLMGLNEMLCMREDGSDFYSGDEDSSSSDNSDESSESDTAASGSGHMGHITICTKEGTYRL